jgi:Domain of unknown function (DUF4349)
MEPPRHDQLIGDLQALRATPRPQFAAELDERAAAGFPRRSRLSGSLFERLRAVPLHRMLIPAGATALLAIVIAVAVVGSNSNNSAPSDQVAISKPKRHPHPAQEIEQTSLPSAGSASSAARKEPGATFAPDAAVESRSAQSLGGDRYASGTAGLHHRAVERSAEITLAADPKDVDDDATRVFEAVHANNGIVMRSSTQEGRPGEAGATFDLLIRSAKLDDAMAAFSEIDAVRTRHEATADITAPTVSAAELLKESRARIDSLLAQLKAAETEEEQSAVEAELRHDRRHASRLAAQLSHLHKRADYSRVSLRIETGGRESSGGGAWGIDDALHDAGHVLTVAAAVTLITLAVLGPIALIALLAWLTHRAWVRRERRRVLS